MDNFSKPTLEGLHVYNPIHFENIHLVNIDDSYMKQQEKNLEQSDLKRELRWPELILLGIGCTIGAGIFVLTGIVARDKTGPALFISFICSGFACLLSAFSYAEMSAMAPNAGSAYGFTRTTFGEFAGWIIGWDLCLEYAVSAASVAQGWSKYFISFLELCGIGFPKIVSTTPWAYDPDTGHVVSTGSIFDLCAVFIVITMTVILIYGVKETAQFNAVIVIIKIIIIFFVIIVGGMYVKMENFEPFMPYGFAGISFFGYTAVGQSDAAGNSVGVLAGASVVFFAYIGFDAVTTNAEECKNPKYDLPIGIIGSLVISTVLYIAISIVLVGMVPYKEIDRDSPLSAAFGSVGLHWAEFIVAIGALLGLTSVLLVNMMGQPRVLMAIARDGLLPKQYFTELHALYKTPANATVVTGVCVALLSSLIPLNILVELVSMGTLMAFGFVNLSVIYLRKYRPELKRPFECPCVPYVPAVGALLCLVLMIALPSANWVRLVVWFLVGLSIYYFYGRHHSVARLNALDTKTAAVYPTSSSSTAAAAAAAVGSASLSSSPSMVQHNVVLSTTFSPLMEAQKISSSSSLSSNVEANEKTAES